MGKMSIKPDAGKERNLARGTIYNMISKVFYFCCGYVIFILIGRELGVKEFGIFGVVFSTMNIAYLFLRNGVPQATSKVIGNNLYNASMILHCALKIQLPWAIFIGAIFFLNSEFISTSILQDKTINIYIKLTSITIIPLALYHVFSGSLVGIRAFGKEAVSMTVTSAVRILLVMVALYFGFGLKGVIYAYILALVSGVLTAGGFSRFPSSAKGKCYQSLILLSIPLAITGGMASLLLSLDSILLKIMLKDDYQVGYYFAALSISHALYHILSSFGITVLPSIAIAHSRKDTFQIQKYIYQITRYMFIISMPVLIIVIAMPDNIITLCYGTSFQPAAKPLQILILGGFFFAISFALNMCLVALERPWVPPFVYLVGLILSLGLCFSLIPAYGTVGAGIAMSSSYLMCFISNIVIIYIKYGKIIKWVSFVRIKICAVILYIIAVKLMSWASTVPMLLFAIFGIIFLYGILLLFSGEWEYEDFAVLKGLLSRRTGSRPSLDK